MLKQIAKANLNTFAATWDVKTNQLRQKIKLNFHILRHSFDYLLHKIPHPNLSAVV